MNKIYSCSLYVAEVTKVLFKIINSTFLIVTVTHQKKKCLSCEIAKPISSNIHLLRLLPICERIFPETLNSTSDKVFDEFCLKM